VAALPLRPPPLTATNLALVMPATVVRDRPAKLYEVVEPTTSKQGEDGSLSDELNHAQTISIGPMTQRLIRIAAWGLIVAIFIMTDAPIGLRPTLGLAPNAERLLAFVVVGLLFVIAYPRRAA
jgi:hypothetical protein